MEKNIARQIIYGNNFIPPTLNNKGWEYLAFGTFDGVYVGEAIKSSSSQRLLDEVWKRQKAFSSELNGKYTFQEEYIYCYEDEDKEEEFWQMDDYPFTFFCHLQFQGNWKIIYIKESLLLEINEKTNALAQVYTSYNNTDILLVVKAKNYAEGTGIISALHKGMNFSEDLNYQCKLRNSFSVFAMKMCYVNRVLEEDIYAVLNKYRIDYVIVRFIEREGKEIETYIQGIKEELKDKIRGIFHNTFILGEDDEILLIQDIGWGDFLSLYQEKNGVFHHEHPEYKKNIAGITTTISTKMDGFENLWESFSLCENDENQSNKDRCINYIEQMRNEVKELDKKEDSFHKELYTILNALPKFFEEKFPDYLFFSVIHPLNTLIKLLKEKGHNSHYYEFIKSFNIYMQSSVKTDKNSMQILDFNAKMYDVPSKLHACYIAYIYYISEILNSQNGKKTYDYLVVPGCTNFIHVVELFQRVSEKERLLRIEIPVDRFYDMENIMIMFAHEAAHYVGTDLRNRPFRYEKLLYSYASIYVNYVVSFLSEKGNLPVSIDGIDWIPIKKRMEKMLHYLLGREGNPDYIREAKYGKGVFTEEKITGAIKYSKNYHKYFSGLRENIYSAMSDMVQFTIPNVFGGIAFGCEKEQQEEMWNNIRGISEKFLVRHTRIKDLSIQNVDTVLEQLDHLYEESYSDMISITLLGLDVKDYLNSLIIENKRQNETLEILTQTEVIYRICVVVDVLRNNAELLKTVYEEDEYLTDRCIIIKAVQKLLAMIKNGWQNQFESEEYRNCSFYALIDNEIYDGVYQYLISCQKLFFEKVYLSETQQEDQNRRELCEKIREFLKKCKDGHNCNIEEQVQLVESFINEYKNQMISNL